MTKSKMAKNEKFKILIVDDSDVTRGILKDILSDAFDILEAADGSTCLKMLKNDKSIKLVLLDLYMPGMDGYEVLRKIREDSSLQHTYVIVTTGDSKKDTEVEAFKNGAVDFIEKPYYSDVVLSRVNNVIRRVVLENEILENKLNIANSQLLTVINLIPDGFSVFKYDDGKVKLERYNKYFSDLFALGDVSEDDTTEWTLDTLLRIVYKDDKKNVSEKIKTAIDNGVDYINCQFRIIRGRNIEWVRMASVFRHINDDLCYCYVLIMDITSEKERERKLSSMLNKLKYLSTHDRLTQLYNRSMFFSEARKLVDNNFKKDFVVVMFDIKNFKVVNELFGSDTGDGLLILIADKMREILGSDGVFGRWGADKYVICMQKQLFDVHKFINEIDETLKSSRILDYNVKVFAGIYNVRDNGMSIEKMCDRAHLAVKAAKHDYVERFAYYDSKMRDEIIEEENIVTEMENALQNNQFKVCYQPIFNVETGKPISAEALVRWIHPKKGMIPPSKFINIFENNKFITKLDTFVLEEVCKYQRSRLLRGKPLIPISVNFSRIDCYMPMICEDMLDLVRNYGINPEYIKIEITETAYTIDKDQIIAATDKFRSSGFKILMDDFGSGYSSLNILSDVNIDTLKIDKKLVDDIVDSHKCRAILTSVVNMAKMIGIDVVAEGVERREQVDFLNDIGCDTIQGFYYAKPMFEDDFEKVV